MNNFLFRQIRISVKRCLIQLLQMFGKFTVGRTSALDKYIMMNLMFEFNIRIKASERISNRRFEKSDRNLHDGM